VPAEYGRGVYHSKRRQMRQVTNQHARASRARASNHRHIRRPREAEKELPLCSLPTDAGGSGGGSRDEGSHIKSALRRQVRPVHVHGTILAAQDAGPTEVEVASQLSAGLRRPSHAGIYRRLVVQILHRHYLQPHSRHLSDFGAG
jgi:hypothetical protein